MENISFYSPTYFVFGRDTESQTGELVKRFGGSKVLIHYGGGSVVRSGLLDRVKKSLDGANVPYEILGGVQPNPRSGLVYEGMGLSDGLCASRGHGKGRYRGVQKLSHIYRDAA